MLATAFRPQPPVESDRLDRFVFSRVAHSVEGTSNGTGTRFNVSKMGADQSERARCASDTEPVWFKKIRMVTTIGLVKCTSRQWMDGKGGRELLII